MREGEYIILDNGKQTSERGGFNTLIFFCATQEKKRE